MKALYIVAALAVAGCTRQARDEVKPVQIVKPVVVTVDQITSQFEDNPVQGEDYLKGKTVSITATLNEIDSSSNDSASLMLQGQEDKKGNVIFFRFPQSFREQIDALHKGSTITVTGTFHPSQYMKDVIAFDGLSVVPSNASTSP